MTRALEHHNAGTALGLWYRTALRDSGTGLIIMDIDTVLYMIEDYKRNIIMFVEEKARADVVHVAQGHMLGTLRGILCAGSKAKGYDFWGLHVLSLQHTTPDNSTWLRWDGRQVDKIALMRYLNLEVKP